MNILNDWKTMRGIPAGVVFNALAQLLPKIAYKAAGVSYLTDINTGFMTRMLESIFGPAGLGWRFDYSVDDLVIQAGEKRINAILKKGTFTYVLVDAMGNMREFSVSSAGSSDNSEDGYAIAGAITATMGQCISRLGWQNPVYCGQVSHTSIEEILRTHGVNFGALAINEDMGVAGVVNSHILPSKANKTDQKTGGTTAASSAPVSTTAPANTTAPVASAPAAKPAAKPTTKAPAAADKPVEAIPAAEPLAAPAASAPASDDPAEYIIPMGNNQGRKLSEMTEKSLRWYAEQLQETDKTRELKQKAAALLKVRAPAAPVN
jgi:hypothetical protein